MSCEQGSHRRLLTPGEEEQKCTKGQRAIGKPHIRTELTCRESAHQTGLADAPLEEDKEMLQLISGCKEGEKGQYGDY